MTKTQFLTVSRNTVPKQLLNIGKKKKWLGVIEKELKSFPVFI